MLHIAGGGKGPPEPKAAVIEHSELCVAIVYPHF
jgi:hypothetical protein